MWNFFNDKMQLVAFHSSSLLKALSNPVKENGLNIKDTPKSGFWCLWRCWNDGSEHERAVPNQQVWDELASPPQCHPNLHPAPCWWAFIPKIMFLRRKKKKKTKSQIQLAVEQPVRCFCDSRCWVALPSSVTVTVPEDPCGPAQVGLCCSSVSWAASSCWMPSAGLDWALSTPCAAI